MNHTSSNAVKMTNREFFRMREENALRQIPGIRELMKATAAQRPELEKKYPDAVFALQVISNPFVKEREVGAISMEAYSAILDGRPVADVRYRYDRQMEAYVARHNWD